MVSTVSKLVMFVGIILMATSCSSTTDNHQGNNGSESKVLKIHDILSPSSIGSGHVVDGEVVRDSTGRLHAFSLVGQGDYEGCMGGSGDFQCVNGDASFKLYHFQSPASGDSWSMVGQPVLLGANVWAEFTAGVGRDGETMVATHEAAVTGTDSMGNRVVSYSYQLITWRQDSGTPEKGALPIGPSPQSGDTGKPVHFIVADSQDRILLEQSDNVVLLDPSAPSGSTFVYCPQEYLGLRENGKAGAEQPSQHVATATPTGDLLILNWNTIRLNSLSPQGCPPAGGAETSYTYAPTLHVSVQREGEWVGSFEVTSDFLRDFHLNRQGDPTPDWYKLGLLDAAAGEDGTVYVLGHLRTDWADWSTLPDPPMTLLFVLEDLGAGWRLNHVGSFHGSRARFQRGPDGTLWAATSERHLYKLAAGDINRVVYGPSQMHEPNAILLAPDRMGILDYSTGDEGVEFAVFALDDLGAPAEGSLTVSPTAGPSPLDVMVSASFTAKGLPLDDAWWYVDFVHPEDVTASIAANPQGIPMTLSAGLHIVAGRFADQGLAEPSQEPDLTPPSIHAASLAVANVVEPVAGSWFERFPVQGFSQISGFPIEADDNGIYAVEPPNTLHIWGRADGGRIEDSNTMTVQTAPWGPPPPNSSIELHKIRLDNNKLIANLWSGGGIGFMVFDISNAPEYTDLGTITVFSPQPNFYPICRDFDVNNGFAACGGDYRFHMADINTMSALGTYDLTGDVLDVQQVSVLDNGFVAVMADTRFALIDPGLSQEGGHTGVFHIVSWIQQFDGGSFVGRVGNRVAVKAIGGGVYWVDCNDPQSPVVSEQVAVESLALNGNQCRTTSTELWCTNLVGTVPNTITTLDVFDPASGDLLGRYFEPRPGGAHSFAVTPSGDAVLPLNQTEVRTVRWHRQ